MKRYNRWHAAIYWGVAVMFSSPSLLMGATVPPGVTLAPLQQLVINNGAEVQSLDPHKTFGLLETKIMDDLLEGLFSFDPQGRVVPGVAIRWQHSTDFTVWTFFLRPEARWSNGDPVTAQDFVYSWRRLVDPKTQSPSARRCLNDLRLLNSEAVIKRQLPPEALGIRALDAHTLQVSLSKPVSYLVKMLADSAFYPLHQPTVERYGNGCDDNKWTAVGHFVGNGAYCLQAWVVNEKIVLTRNPHYWDRAHSVIERVTYLPIHDEIVDIRRYQAGEIDISNHLMPTDNYLDLQQKLPSELRRFPSLSVFGYQMNTLRVPFKDVRVRQALSLVLDRDAIVNQFLVQGERKAYTLNSDRVQGFKAIQPAWTAWPWEQRVAKAQQLLQAAGYSAARPLRFRLLYNMSETHEQLAVLVSDLWKRTLGAEVTLEKQEWKFYLNSCLEGDYQMARFGWPALYNEPAALLNTLLSNSSDNSVFYNNPRFDDWLDRALQAETAAERLHCYQQAEQLLFEEVPLIPLYHGSRSRLVKPCVGGLDTCNPMNRFYTKDLYLIQRPQGPSRYRQ